MLPPVALALSSFADQSALSLLPMQKVLHSAVSVSDILRSLWRQHYIAVEADRLVLPSSSSTGLTSLGKHVVTVLLGDDRSAKANLSVVVEQR